LVLRKVVQATALLIAGMLLAGGCGGTLEGKYRRGQITTSTTAGQRAPGATSTTGPTGSTVPTSGNAAGQGGRG
jgi:hypothetical protein